MCGIIGFLDQTKKTSQNELIKMRDSLIYRGPDSAGYFFKNDKKYNIGLGHRRLSILDLSDLGSQPMEFENLTIIHNGEVYNFSTIKQDLIDLGYKFISNTDTEVILKSFHAWGVKCIDKFRGMFAFAIYDKYKDKLYIFRDRAGVKPLFYYKKEGLFLFSSELKAFYKHPKFKKVLNKNALPYYFRFGYIPAPLTIFENTYKLKQGHYLEIDCLNNNYKEICYWSVEDFYREKKNYNSEVEVIQNLERLLIESFQLRMVSDVPVGVFLSGGVDSSIVTALLQKNSIQKINTFTIGFENKKYDEAKYAKEIAQYLGTNHHEYYCSNSDMLDIVDKLSYIYDEPFGDSSAIPTYLVSRIAKEKVSVALSGDGGDETFIGYSKYKVLNQISNLSKSKRYILKGMASLLNENHIEFLNDLLPNSKKQRNIKDKYSKFKESIFEDNPYNMFINASSYVDTETLNFILNENGIDFSQSNFNLHTSIKDLEYIDFMTLLDYKTFMADDILTKVDRASMAVSLEAREPLLDHKLIEFMAKIPKGIKYKNNTQKYLLKKILYKYIPKELIERPKAGFQVPLMEWMRSDLKEQVEYFLSEDRLNKSNIYDVNNIIKLKNDLFLGKNINLSVLWFILMFEMWKERWIN